MRVAHIITRMIIGGAQENTLYNCLDLVNDFQDNVLLLTGPSAGPEGSLLDQHDLGKLQVQEVKNLRRSINPWHDIQAYFQIKKQLKEFQPEVVHTHSAKGGILGRLAASSLKIPAIIHTVHGAPFYPYQNPVTRRFYIACERYAARRCHQLISVADAMTDLLVDAQVAPKEKFQTIYSGMEVEPFLGSDLHREATRAELGIEPQHVVVGKIARLVPLKGHEYVIAGAKEVIKACPEVRFLFIGDGSLKQNFEEMIATAGLTKYFIMPGLVSPSEIPKMISAFDILVHTSLREGLARALPQALLCGKPTVSFDIDGAKEVVINDETGCLIPPKDTQQLTAALISLSKDPELRVRLGKTGQKRMQEIFPHALMTKKIRELYQKILHENKK